MTQGPDNSRSAEEIRAWLVKKVAEVLRIDEAEIDPAAPFSAFGLSSVAGVELSGEIERWLGRPVSPLLAYEYPSIEALSGYLAKGPETPTAPRKAAPGFETSHFGEIAVIGMACRFPGANNPEEFWEALRNGRDLIQEVPPDRWNLAEFYDSRLQQPGKMQTRWGGFIPDVDAFDCGFFGISRREAAQMDPQQRLLIEVAWEALENAGIPSDTLAGTRTGVFTGISSTDNLLLQSTRSAPIDIYAATGNAHSIAANRISYLLDLRGPSMAVDTACSSSLVALDLAVQNLRLGRCDAALAAGVNLVLAPYGAVVFSQMGAMAADGRCKTFDASADGYVRSEGAGVVVLKRLTDAIRDNDNVLAVILGSAVNQDGRTNGLTAPNGASQRSVITDALSNAGLAPSQIGYVEAHGTGTPLGDPIEFEALATVLGQGRAAEQVCYLGSVKSNIGHLEAAAGIASFIKVVLALRHKEIPPCIHFRKINPEIRLEGSGFRIPTQPQAWPAVPRIAGVSSFGFGGTNAHVIVREAAEPVRTASAMERPVHLLALSAKTDDSLARLAQRYADWFAAHPDPSLADVCYSANTGRAVLEKRAAFAASNLPQMREQLGGFVKAGKAAHSKGRGPAPKIAFLFPGQGCQYLGMAAGLYRTQPVFRRAIDQCAALSLPFLERPLEAVLYGEQSAESAVLSRPLYAQAALFAVGYGLSELWQSWGVKPEFVLGHSVGEYTAACVAGVLGVEDALRLLAERARNMEALPRGGLMAAVFAGAARVRDFLPDTDDVVVAALNSPQNTVLSGKESAVRDVLERLAAAGIESSVLGVPLSSHSPLVEPILDSFEAAGRPVPYRCPRIRFASTLTGRVLEADYAPDALYWRNHLRQPVQFEKCVRSAIEAGADIFLELGPTSLLTSLGITGFAEAGRTWLPSLQKQADDWQIIANTVASLYASGAPIDWAGFDAPYSRSRVDVPTYPFARDRFPRSGPEPPNRSLMSEPAPPFAVPSKSNGTGGRRREITGKLQALIAPLLGETAADLDVSTSFLMMGADSIVLARALQGIESEFGLKISPRQLFTGLDNIEKLAAHIDETTGAPEAPVSPAEITTDHEAPEEMTGSAIERIVQRQLDAMNQLAAAQIAALSGAVSRKAALVRSPAPEPQPPVSHGNAGHQANTGSLGLADAAFPEVEMPDEDSAVRRAHLKQFIARYCERTKTSKRLAQENRVTHADFRNSIKLTAKTKELRYQIVADRAKGSKFWDVDGNEYVDLTMGFGVNLFGHCPEFVTEAIREQMERGMFLGPVSGVAFETSKLICELTGSERVLFSNTGTEAVMAALRVARTVTSRAKVAMFDGSYHGGFDGVLAISGEDPNGPALPGMPGISDSMVQDTYVLEYGSERALDFIRNHGDELAAVIVEPVQSRRPGFQPCAFLHEVRRLTEKTGTALIFDECVTGFRIHLGGAQAFFDVRADLTVYGKILGGGMPIGVVAGSARFLDAIDGGAWNFGDQSIPRKTRTFVAGTFCKHPLAMAAARAVLRHLAAEGPALQTRLNGRAEMLAARINRFFEERVLPLKIDTFGSLFRITSPFNVGRSVDMDLLFYHIAERGVHVWEGRTCFLSTAHTDADIDRIADAIEGSAAELQAANYLSKAPAARNNGIGKPEGRGNTGFPLTEAQEQMWVLSMVGNAGFEPTTVRIDGPLDPALLRKAVQEVAQRHESLRTVFAENGDRQTVLPEWNAEIPLFDISSSPSASRNAEAADLLEREARRPFDLKAAPPWRVTMIRLEPESHLVVLTAHHIIVDGWSSVVLLKEVFEVYSAISAGEELRLPPPVQFREYARWLENLLATDELKRSEEYWLQRFSGSLPDKELPADHPRGRTKTYRGARESTKLESGVLNRLKAFARQERSTLFMVLFAAYGALLHRLSQHREIIVGFAVSGRTMPGCEGMIGYCNHLVPIRLNAGPGIDFSSYLSDIRNQVLEAYDHQQYPFARLLNKLNPGRDPNRPALLTSTFNLEPPVTLPSLGKMKAELMPSPIGFTGGDIHLNVTELDDGLLVHVDYDCDLFEGSTIARMLGQYGVLLDSILEPGPQGLWTMPMLTAAERDILLDS